MKESITIKNFGGLKDLTISLNSINIFIGKQASGKSVTAKLIYFFRKAFEDIFDGINEDKEQESVFEGIRNRFKKYFPAESWSNKGKFIIQYQPEDCEYNLSGQSERINFSKATVKRKGKADIEIDFSETYSHISTLRKGILDRINNEIKSEKSLARKFDVQSSRFVKLYYHNFVGQTIKPFGLQTFVPAGRSFFSNIQSSIFSILAQGYSIDPFLLEFGQFYEHSKTFTDDKPSKLAEYIEKCLSEIVNAKYFRDKTGEFLIHNDGRKINLLFCSSGQQEILPLALVLRNIAILSLTETYNYTFYIEEPEAHLFPSAQKQVVEMMATSHNISKDKSQLIITTHSPYILTSFNNLLQAGQLLKNGVNKKKLFNIVPELEILKPGELNAFAFADGDVKNLVDEETGLISADLLDEVSEEIAVQFDELLEL